MGFTHVASHQAWYAAVNALFGGIKKFKDDYAKPIEIDRDLHAHLKGWFTNESNFTIHQADALQFDYGQLIKPEHALRVVGNLPYNISTPLIFHLLGYASAIRDMHFMLQKEVVQRMAAGPGGGDYGRLSVMVQYRCKVEALFIVPPGAFNPPPKVESAVVRLTPFATPPHPAQDEACLRQVVNAAFQQRRKTLRNGLKGLITAEALESLGIDSKLRAEQLPLADFVRISNAISGNPENNE